MSRPRKPFYDSHSVPGSLRGFAGPAEDPDGRAQLLAAMDSAGTFGPGTAHAAAGRAGFGGARSPLGMAPPSR